MLDQILDAIRNKKWEVYYLPNGENLEANVHKGPTPTLEKNKRYIVVPAVEGEWNVDRVREVFGSMMKRRWFPRFYHNDNPWGLATFTVNERTILCEQSYKLDYLTFLECLKNSLRAYDEVSLGPPRLDEIYSPRKAS